MSQQAIRAGQYLRVSVDSSGRERSLDEQQVENERDVDRNGWLLTRTYRDANRSASRFARRGREDYAVLLDDLHAGALDVLILWESSRGSRRVGEWVSLLEVCEQQRVRISVTSHGRVYEPWRPRDRRSLLEDAVDSEYESGKISERILRTVRATAEAGGAHGTTSYGYVRRYDERTRRLVGQDPDPETAPVVREIAARVIAGEALHAICVDLDARGVETPQARKDRLAGREVDRQGWTSSKLRRLLASRTITGMREHCGELHEGAWEPIVSAADFALVQAILRDPVRGAHHRGVEPRHLLSGLATCGVCGAWLRVQRNRGRPSYICGGRGPGTPKGHVLRAQDLLDAWVTLYVLGRLRDPGLLSGLADLDQERDQRGAEVAVEVSARRSRLAQFEAAAAAGEVSASAFGRIEQRLRGEIEELERGLRGAPALPAAVVALAGADAGQRWEEAPLQVQRLTVRSFAEVVVHRSRRPQGVRGFDADAVEIRKR